MKYLQQESGEPGFAFPSGCPSGLLASLAYGPRDIPRGGQAQALPPLVGGIYQTQQLSL